jgi:hypothetical protein
MTPTFIKLFNCLDDNVDSCIVQDIDRTVSIHVGAWDFYFIFYFIFISIWVGLLNTIKSVLGCLHVSDYINN